MNKNTVYRNIIIINFFFPLIVMVLTAILVLQGTSYLCSFFTDNPWNNPVFRWTMLVFFTTTYSYVLANSTYVALQRHDSTFYISERILRIIRLLGAILYMGIMYVMYRTMHSPLKSAALAILLYGILTQGPLVWEKIWGLRNKKTV